MTLTEIKQILARGENSNYQFKETVTNVKSLSSEMVAFSNAANGGTIIIGVDDDCTLKGLSLSELKKVNQHISNAASQGVRNPITVETESISLENERLVIILKIPSGIHKPYLDQDGVIWLKSGSDKRRANSSEEILRLFHSSSQIYPDELSTRVGIEALDFYRFRDRFENWYGRPIPENVDERRRIFHNMGILNEDYKMNIASVLFFARNPHIILPQFPVKAIRFPGSNVHSHQYIDSEDFEGTLDQILLQAIGFVMRQLHKVQAGNGVNSRGTPEIPKVVFEELIVNALMHRNYLINAPVCIFVFDNRIEIISPGYLPNNLTVEQIRIGQANIRNSKLLSFISKGLMPYRGVGTGIPRALSEYKYIDFNNDRDANRFIVTIHRKPIEELNSPSYSSPYNKNHR